VDLGGELSREAAIFPAPTSTTSGHTRSNLLTINNIVVCASCHEPYQQAITQAAGDCGMFVRSGLRIWVLMALPGGQPSSAALFRWWR
jgi:hypothetical protein